MGPAPGVGVLPDLHFLVVKGHPSPGGWGKVFVNPQPNMKMKQHSHFCTGEKPAKAKEESRTAWSREMCKDPSGPTGAGHNSRDGQGLVPLHGWCHRASLSLCICCDRHPSPTHCQRNPPTQDPHVRASGLTRHSLRTDALSTLGGFPVNSCLTFQTLLQSLQEQLQLVRFKERYSHLFGHCRCSKISAKVMMPG